MPLVFGVCMKYLKDREESKDAVMQLFEYLIDALKKHEVTNFKSWLYVTTRNQCLMQLRKSGREVGSENLSYSLVESVPEEHPNGEGLEEDLVRLENCIDKLRDVQRDCVRLFYLEKKSYAEITELTGHSTKNVKSFIQNGRRNLKICMESDD